MKITHGTRIIGSLLIFAILTSRCASTTIFKTEPTGASVYINEKEKGTTPYNYTDIKVIFSSTPVTFKKAGYEDLNVTLKRSEQPAFGPIFAGLFLIYPLLWSSKYKESHFYELERSVKTNQDSSIIAEHKIDSIIKSDNTITLNQISNHARDTLSSINTNEFTETKPQLQINKGTILSNGTVFQFGAGIGICLKGALLGLNSTFIGSKRWGASISYNVNPIKARDLPYDYDRPFTPIDYVNVFSLNLLRAFPSPNRNSRFTIEAGPSWVCYNKVGIELSPHYDPNYDEESWFWNFWNGKSRYKYDKYRIRNSTIGASVIGKMEFLYSPHASIGIKAFTNINSLKTIAGLGFYIYLGDVRD